MRSKKVLVFTIFLLVLTLSPFTSAIDNTAQVKVKVFNENTNAEITEATVTFTKVNRGTDQNNAPYTNGFFTDSIFYPDEQILEIKIEKQSFLTRTEQFTLNVDSVNPAVAADFVNYTLTPIPSESFLASESFRSTSCESHGAVLTENFTDNEGNTINHCIKRESFTSGNEYVVDSYLQDAGNDRICDTDYEREGDDFQAYNPDGGDGDRYYLCVKKDNIANQNDEAILRDAKIRVNEQTCDSVFESNQEPLEVNPDDTIIHCKNPENIDLIDRFECRITNAHFGDFQRNQIDNYNLGSSTEDLYLYAIWENCEDEDFEFTLERIVDGTIATFGPFSQASSEQQVPWSWYKWTEGPVWPTDVPGIGSLSSIGYKFKVKVSGKNIERESNTLTVSPEEPPCDNTNNPCDSGYTCIDGECLEIGNCSLNSPRWRDEVGGLLLEENDATVRGWIDGPEWEDGDIVQMFIDITSECQGKEIKFKIKERDTFVDDDVQTVVVEGTVAGVQRYEIPFRSIEIDRSGFFSRIGNWFDDFFEGNTKEMYFIAEIESENIVTENSDILKVTPPVPDGFCEDDSDCRDSGENFVCTDYECLDSSVNPCELTNPNNPSMGTILKFLNSKTYYLLKA